MFFINQRHSRSGAMKVPPKRSLIIPETKQSAIFDEIFPPPIDEKSFPNDADTFHQAIAPVLFVGQIFGVLPVTGIFAPNASHLSFSWFSWRVGYTFIIMIGSALLSILTGIKAIILEANTMDKISSIVYYGSTSASLVLFLRLAPLWPSVGRALAEVESSLRVGYPAMYTRRPIGSKRSLKFRLNTFFFFVLSMALVEHLLSIIAGVAGAMDCGKKSTLAASYFTASFGQFFYFLDYALWKAMILLILNLSAAFNWNFTDLFIIMMSMGLKDRFERLNDRLYSAHGKNLPQQFWRNAREEFARLSKLVSTVDDAINWIVLLSFANNLFFICLQLFNTLEPLWGYSNVIYFTYSFAFLLARSLAVSFRAAAVHSETRRPAAVLYVVPSASYCTEAHRFVTQVVTDTVAFTALNFFYITRSLVLSIAGTIVTYELVLVQFSESPSPSTNNTIQHMSCALTTPRP